MPSHQKGQRLLPQKPEAVIRAFKHAGFRVRGETGGLPKSRTAGSHVIMDDLQTGRMVAVTNRKGHEISPALLRKLIKDAGLTVDEFLGYLGRKAPPPERADDPPIVRVERIQ